MGKAAEAEKNQAGDVQTSYLEQPTAEKQVKHNDDICTNEIRTICYISNS